MKFCHHTPSKKDLFCILTSVLASLLLAITAHASSWQAALPDNKSKPSLYIDVEAGTFIGLQKENGGNTMALQSNDPVKVTLRTGSSAPSWQSIASIPETATNVVRDKTTVQLFSPTWETGTANGNMILSNENTLATADFGGQAAGPEDNDYVLYWIRGSVSVTVDYHYTDYLGNNQYRQAHESIQFYISLNMYRFWNIKWGADGETLNAEAYQIEVIPPGDTFVRNPMQGATVQPKSSVFQFAPAGATMSLDPQNPEVARVDIEMVSPIGTSVEGLTNGSIQLTVNDYDVGVRTVENVMATIVSTVGDVQVSDNFQQLVDATPGMRIAPGARLLGRNIPRQDGTILYPSATVRFSNGVTETIDLVEANGTSLAAQIGRTGVDAKGKRYSRFDLDLKELHFTVMNDPREMAARVVKKSLGFLAGELTGGAGWFVGDLTEMGIEQYYNYSVRNRQTNRDMRLADPQSSVKMATFNYGQAENYTWRLFEDGSVQIDNDGPSLIISASDGREIFIPTRTSRTFTYETGEPGPIIPRPAPYPYENPQTISPADGSPISTRTPTIHIDHHYGVQKGSVACWINGYNVGPQMTFYPYTSYHQVNDSYFTIPPEMRLDEGENVIEVRGIDGYGTTFSATSIFTASGKPAPPAHPSALSGADTIVLRWDANREHDIAGYRVYRAADRSSFFVFVGESLEPVFIDYSPDAAELYYRVTAFDTNDVESDPSVIFEAPPLVSPGDPTPSLPTPATFSATAQNGAILIDLGVPPNDNAAWKLERSEGGGSFSNLISNGQGFLGRKKIVDSDVLFGTSYRYRLTSYNGELAAAASIVSSEVSPLDQPPAPPKVVTADLDGKTVLVRWNPSLDRTCTGYRVQVKTDTGSYEAVEDVNASTRSFSFDVDGRHVYYFAISALDDQQREGELSIPAEVGTWHLSPNANSNFPWVLFIPVINSARNN